jgi:hypothetical protein
MLGFEDQKTTIIKEPFASELVKKLIRFRKGKFNKKELSLFKKEKELMKKYRAIWKDE